MQDRFRFRAKRLDNNKFVYGYLCFIYIDNEKHCRIYSPDDAMSYDCYTETLGQNTGLKDKNSKLIYEGDIVEIMVWDDYSEDMIETKGKVYWSKEDASFLIFVSYDGEYSLNSQETFYGREIEVIGNIHENPELLESN